jgi:hypothetical protein
MGEYTTRESAFLFYGLEMTLWDEESTRQSPYSKEEFKHGNNYDRTPDFTA